MLHQGRMELEGAKKTVEGVLEDVQALKGLWGWFIGLFTSKQPKPTTQKPVAIRPLALEDMASHRHMIHLPPIAEVA